MNFLYPLAVISVAIGLLLALQNALNYLAIALFLFAALCGVAVALMPTPKDPPS